jgi:hypothetical protein
MVIWLNDVARCPISSFVVTPMKWLRSPPEIRFVPRTSSLIGLSMKWKRMNATIKKMAATETKLATMTWPRAHAIWLSTSLRSMVTSITPRTFCDLG